VTPADLRVHIRQLCCLDLPAEQLVPALLKAVRQLVDADSAGFFWVDSHGDLTSLYAERLLPAPVMESYFARYYESDGSSFRRAFTERMLGTQTVIASSPTAESQSSPIYNEVLRHLDAHHVLYGIARESGHAIGQMSLYRSKAARAFSATQKTELSGIMRYVAHGVSHRQRRGADVNDYQDTDDDAVFLADAGGEISQLSSASRKLLALATQGKIGPASSIDELDYAARPALRGLVERLRLVLVGIDTEPPRIILHNAFGRFVLRAYSLGDAPLQPGSNIAVSIRRQEPLLLKFVGALSGLALSPQQREVAVGLARGSSNRELAEALGISINTVAYHIKQLFQKLDAHDRPEMMAKVLGRPR
jgi:DNA-binding CsgD family transcriptional regulator